MPYNYLLFAKEKNALDLTEPTLKDLVGRSTGLSDILSLVDSPDISNKHLVILRFNDLEIGAVLRGFDGWEVYDLPGYFRTDSQKLLENVIDQIASREIIIASLNMHNSIKLKDKESFKVSYETLSRDKIQTARIIRNQLEILYSITTDSELGFIPLLKLWWKTVQDDKKNNSQS